MNTLASLGVDADHVVSLAIFLVTGLFLGFVFTISVVRRAVKGESQKQLAKQQDQFVGLSSHYLLTPMTAIQAAVARLQEVDKLSLESREKLYEAISRSERRLWIMAQELILVNRFNTNQFQLEMGVGSLSDIISDAIRIIDPFARQKLVKVSLADATQGNSQTRADVRLIKQAFVALLDNAIKFSPEGSQVGVALGIGKGICQVVIADAGVGMSADVISHAAEKFYRGTGIYEFDYEGMGLGLYIAQTIVTAHAGVIRIQSAPNAGTRVTVEFPNL
jgi:signal transduction histidine kinase